ncbi:hypothetical protein HGG75_10370 [Ochrobactrum pseudogrignonense]|nr:hypothetical protein [Brucella pseudogrignonensis]
MNRQLTILNEIGTQSIREVGFAFGEWLPTINEWLLAGIRWVRQIDQATGGWMKTLLTGTGGVVLGHGAWGARPCPSDYRCGSWCNRRVDRRDPITAWHCDRPAGWRWRPDCEELGQGRALMKFWDGLKDRASKAWEGTKRLWDRHSLIFPASGRACRTGRFVPELCRGCCATRMVADFEWCPLYLRQHQF